MQHLPHSLHEVGIWAVGRQVVGEERLELLFPPILVELGMMVLGIVKPKIRGHTRAGVLSQIAVIVVLLKRVAAFIIKVTLALRKTTISSFSPRSIPGPEVPPFIRNLIQREEAPRFFKPLYRRNQSPTEEAWERCWQSCFPVSLSASFAILVSQIFPALISEIIQSAFGAPNCRQKTEPVKSPHRNNLFL